MARTYRSIIRFGLIALIVLPVICGLCMSLLASFGILPAINAQSFSLQHWVDFFSYPRLVQSLTVSLVSSVLAIAIALPMALLSAQYFHHKKPKWMLLILASPHSAFAIGFSFLIAPSGWLMRLFAQIFGWSTPPSLITIGDPLGIALGLGLAIKELPFLIIVTLGLINTLPLRDVQKTAASLGYDMNAAWEKLIIPQLLPLMRLPIFITFVYALTNVDMALILGPSLSPSLPVLITRLYNNPDITQILTASSGAIFLAALVALSSLLGLVLERFTIARILKRSEHGQRNGLKTGLIFRFAMVLLMIGMIAILANFLWSVTWRWSFPSSFPEAFSLRNWQSALGNKDVILNSFIIAISASLISLVLAILWLEISKPSSSELIFMTPLIIPQLSFLFGFVLCLNYVNLSPMVAIIWAHMFFTFPYILIMLSASWRGIDPRLVKTAKSLGKSPLAILLHVKIPMQIGALMLAFAVGIAVSIAQYLPTLFASGGRVDTITTEAITLASGSDRRLTGAFSFMQILIPVWAFAIANKLPHAIFRNRRAMLGG